jgi:hypothetical protein
VYVCKKHFLHIEIKVYEAAMGRIEQVKLKLNEETEPREMDRCNGRMF